MYLNNPGLSHRCAWTVKIAAAAFILGAAGCAKTPPEVSPAPTAAKHEHHAPHGGTAIVLGQEAYHVEFVLNPSAGTITAYILDGELENFLRIPAPSFEVRAAIQGHPQTLVFHAVANPATGEMVGDTAQFEAQAPWLKDVPAFDAVLTALTIRGSQFTNVAFNIPRGNEAP